MSDEREFRGTGLVTSVRLQTNGGHVTVAIWINHGKAGELCVRLEEVKPLLRRLLIEPHEVR